MTETETVKDTFVSTGGAYAVISLVLFGMSWQGCVSAASFVSVVKAGVTITATAPWWVCLVPCHLHATSTSSHGMSTAAGCNAGPASPP